MTKPVSKISNKSKIKKSGKRLRKVSKGDVLKQDQRKKKKKEQ